MVEGDGYDSRLQRTIGAWNLNPPFNVTGTGRAKANGGSLSGVGDIALQISYEHSYRDELYGAPTLNILDLDFQHRIAQSDRSSFLWGLGYRLTNLEFESPSGAHPFPSGVRRDNLYQAFFEDQYEFIP